MAPKSVMQGSDILRLIQEVKNRGVLWNPAEDNYGTYHSLKAWEDIAKSMDMPEDILRLKWKSLRDFFNREVKRKNVKHLDDYGGKWRYFKNLSFIFRPAKDGDGEQPDAQTGSENDEQEINYAPKYEPDSNLEVYLEEEDPIPEKRFKNDDENYDLMFLKSLTPFLMQLEPTRNLVVRSRMQDMLLNEIAAQNMNRNKNS